MSVLDSRQQLIDRALSGMLGGITSLKNEKIHALDEELRREKARLAENNRPRSDESAEKLVRLQDRVGELRDSVDLLRREISNWSGKRQFELPPFRAADDDWQWSEEEIDNDLEDIEQEISRARVRFSALRGSLTGMLANRSSMIMACILVLALGAAATTTAMLYKQSLTVYAIIGGCVAGTMLLLVLKSGKGAAAPLLDDLESLWNFVNRCNYYLDRMEKTAKDRLSPLRFLDKQIQEVMALEESINKRRNMEIETAGSLSAALRKRHQRLQARLDRRREAALAVLEKEFGGGVQKLKADHQAEVAQLEAEWKSADRECARERDAGIEELRSQWQEALDGFLKFAADAMQCRNRALQASDASGGDIQLPAEFPLNVFVGRTVLDLNQMGLLHDENDPHFELPGNGLVELPVALSFPTSGSLQVEAPAAGRERAVSTLLSTALSLLKSFPAGKIKLTLLDPVGLGESFAALMQLSEYDETLVRGRIWTESAHLERKLSDLTERIEKVIQNYLRNRYATVADYNREAGQLAEPYEFLVVADYPSGFSDLARERLASVLTSGPRCGVYTLMHCSRDARLPEGTDTESLARSMVLLKDDGQNLRLDHRGLANSRLEIDPLPDPETMSGILDSIGKHSSSVQQVQLPFEAIVPSEKEFWSLSAAAGLRVPIGRTGADRLQYLDLGKGTAQHALVAGRTGSGKSTLFHVIITATSMWFSPREVEFYLVDFKHGVEFKMFARQNLPHARVIAIESDREFGLSVLQKINEELTRRGNMFRKAGVQDLAAYRQAVPDDHLSRVVLMIDEFQEFFTEDDVIARDVALLLDRFVRQGRAFGIHVILGSQTLSGMYTLAKSTLGQMGVRIALQCNEADSQLILSEDNSAARLLSHSGEAIYNDMSGLLEGNSPFQVVWLSEEEQEVHLKSVAEHTGSHPELQPAGKCVVFEGSLPAELSENQLLEEALENDPGRDDIAGTAWVGAASSIKGPTEVRFLQAGGSNLLIVGQNREAAFATTAAVILGLAAGHAREDASFVVFEGEGKSAEYAASLEALTAAVGPDRLKVPAPREVEKVLRDITREHLADKDGESSEAGPRRRTYLVVFGLQRFRALREEDSFALPSDEGEDASPGEMFANLLREGAEHGVHVIVWCDTLANLTRSLARSAMREFDMRILFQMSGGDSSELCDSSAASNLGLHKAMLTVQSDGSIEKFRPYSTPDPEFLQQAGEKLRARQADS